jgi:hypothetical protein
MNVVARKAELRERVISILADYGGEIVAAFGISPRTHNEQRMRAMPKLTQECADEIIALIKEEQCRES